MTERELPEREMSGQDSLERPGVGLIGGLAVGATIYHYQTMVDACQARGSSPNLLIAHADVEHVLKLIGTNQLEQLAEYYLGFVETLEHAGVKAVAIGAVAPHLCFPNLLAKTQMPMISLVTETRREIQARGFGRVTLFGNRASMETKLFNGLEGIDVCCPTLTRSASFTRRTPPLPRHDRGHLNKFQVCATWPKP